MPRFGELQAADLNDIAAADVWAVAARTLTDISAEEIFDLPEIDSVYPPVSCLSAATANTFGSWVEVSADVGVGKRLLGVYLQSAVTPAAGPKTEVEFGEGAGGSEAAITRAEVSGFAVSAAGYLGGFYVPLWRSLTDNARLAVRAKDDNGGAQGYTVGVLIA